METTEKKPWWVKRWVCKPFDWCERKFFEEHATSDYLSSSFPVYFAFMACILGVCAVALVSMFLSHGTKQTVGNWMIGIVIAICLLNTGYHIYQTLPAFPSMKVKIIRSLYVIASTVLIMMLGFWLGNVVFFVAIILLALVVIGFFAGGSDNKNSGDVYVLDDGTRVKKEKGLLGEVTWRGNDGHTYERDGDTFRRI